ncbi:hypothetical protein KUTeg_007085 [Tegillarca granosa]|uniref:Glycoprotein endo-alpha-1,2-mannosidase n=1 Tax=Tegillarca granosa TaxID=220873 RepID=A0ABQ9FF89_TEGGR|nr:hypothetical protein KUTeg_007085 [Tegillarca granosa]
MQRETLHFDEHFITVVDGELILPNNNDVMQIAISKTENVEEDDRGDLPEVIDSRNIPVADNINMDIPDLNEEKQVLKDWSFNLNLRGNMFRDNLLNEISDLPEDLSDTNEIPTNYKVHVFYYPWYGNLKFNGEYVHWNHPFIPHWKENEALNWPQGQHEPPDDIGSNFYPELGPYSSNDPETIKKHMEQISSTGAGVVVVSWYPPNESDDHGKDPDKVIPTILDIADQFSLKVTLHIEPFKGRNHKTLRENLKYILDSYGKHPAFYKCYHADKEKHLPMFYIYDSYLTEHYQWSKIFTPQGNLTVRHTDLDAIFIGLVVENHHISELYKGGFDGVYTYFATDGFSFGSSWKNWPYISQTAKSRHMFFIPSVGPGYIDTNVRPWNVLNTRSRQGGRYYLQSISAALSNNPDYISVTSFNEWHEGTQIEPAVPMKHDNLIYLDYGSRGPKFYLKMTKYLVKKFSEIQPIIKMHLLNWTKTLAHRKKSTLEKYSFTENPSTLQSRPGMTRDDKHLKFLDLLKK